VLRKNVPLKGLKERLVSSRILSFPNEFEEFILDTDASNHGIGAVLSQIQGDSEKVIAYYSRILTKAERNYCVTRRELLAIVDSVKFFHHYLYGRKFLIRTDHISLRWLLSFKDLEGQLARWMERLQQYEFEVIHKGRLHLNANGLSRRPCAESRCNYCNKIESREKLLARITFSEGSPVDWRKLQLEDSIVSIFLQAKQKDRRPLRQEIFALDNSAKIYWSYWDSLFVKDGVLFKK